MEKQNSLPLKLESTILIRDLLTYTRSCNCQKLFVSDVRKLILQMLQESNLPIDSEKDEEIRIFLHVTDLNLIRVNSEIVQKLIMLSEPLTVNFDMYQKFFQELNILKQIYEGVTPPKDSIDKTIESNN